MTPKIGASIEAIRAISHQFAQRQTATRWLKWLHRKLSIAVIDRLIEKYTPPDLFQFGTDEMVELCEGLYKDVGSPEVSSVNGWPVLTAMINKL